jgi:large subunit ribosomal protein L15
MRLNELADNPGARKARKRLGRGVGSGTGKTAGRGAKGQKSRSGVAIKGFEGGQMPIHMRLPKRGFNNPLRKRYNVVNLDRVQEAIDAGKLNAGEAIDVAALQGAGLVRRALDGVRLLARGGELKVGAKFEVAGASEAAVKAVEAAGGSVTILVPRKIKAGDEDAAEASRTRKKAPGGKK